jgi:hypothetical protein
VGSRRTIENPAVAIAALQKRWRKREEAWEAAGKTGRMTTTFSRPGTARRSIPTSSKAAIASYAERMDYPSGLNTVDPAETASLAGEKVGERSRDAREDFRPSGKMRTALEGNQNARKCLKDLVSAVGIEPTTY